MYCSVGFLLYLLTDPLKIALKELDALINFVKSELLHKQFLRILSLFMKASAYHNNMALMSTRICIVKCIPCFFSPWVRRNH